MLLVVVALLATTYIYICICVVFLGTRMADGDGLTLSRYLRRALYRTFDYPQLRIQSYVTT